MTEWSPEDVRQGILITLYKEYMQDCRRPVVFSKEALEKDDPPFSDVYREVKQLEHWGWLEIRGGMMGAILCRLTPQGRDVFEKMLGEETDLESRPPIGYEVE